MLEEITQNDIEKNNDIKMIREKRTTMGKGESTFIKLFPEGKRRTNDQKTQRNHSRKKNVSESTH